MPGLKRRCPNIYNVHVPLEVAQHSCGAYAIVAAFIKHLAFAREQCHAPLSDLERLVQACKQERQLRQHTGRRLRLKASTRKAIKFHDRLSALIRLAANIPFAQLQHGGVWVLLGSSVTRPREVYCFRFPSTTDQQGLLAASEKAISDASRRFLRTLIMQHEHITEWDDTPGPTKMFLLCKTQEGALEAAPEGFVARRAFQVNLRKAFQVNIIIGSQATEQQASPGNCDVEMQELSQRMSAQMSLTDAGAAEVATPHVWYQAMVHVKGLRVPNTCST
eukprot:GHRR01013266.1.p1 GENE.GHRR01013266.1~~GHRR01013266.1.p1  ORF type:complete len:277 (+),score=85.69 GHRR01013266.1:308-1138(+)